jgi:hypothetical protein
MYKSEMVETLFHMRNGKKTKIDRIVVWYSWPLNPRGHEYKTNRIVLCGSPINILRLLFY